MWVLKFLLCAKLCLSNWIQVSLKQSSSLRFILLANLLLAVYYLYDLLNYTSFYKITLWMEILFQFLFLFLWFNFIDRTFLSSDHTTYVVFFIERIHQDRTFTVVYSQCSGSSNLTKRQRCNRWTSFFGKFHAWKGLLLSKRLTVNSTKQCPQIGECFSKQLAKKIASYISSSI